MNANNPLQHAVLTAADGQSIALKSVHLQGRLEALMLSTRVRQQYANETTVNLETVYTFPLPWGATLLALHVELGGKRLQGQVLEKVEAIRHYERAIEDGDTPIMVERSGEGLYSANLGNILPGEQATIEIEYAQLLRFEAGRIRLAIPTVIAPRFGDSHKQGSLALHQSAVIDALAEYPFTLKIDLHGSIAGATITSPSHRVNVAPIERGQCVTLAEGAMLDRDFVLELDGMDRQSFAVAAADGDHHMVVASFCPNLPSQPNNPLCVKVLVDCSGSMAGDSMEQAKQALTETGLLLDQGDLLSYSKFGSRVEHPISLLTPCTSEFIRGAFARALNGTDADMGGTEMHAALQSTFATEKPAQQEAPVDLLLITDGAVWDVDWLVDLARESGHRIFGIGVGSAPAESLLRELAEKSGGACELVSPNEDIASAVMRVFRRMRASHSIEFTVDWGTAPSWQSALPCQLVDGETVHLFARFAEMPSNAPTLSWVVDGVQGQTRPADLVRDDTGTVARMGGAKRMAQAVTAAEATAFGRQYQLVSAYTNLILVHVRDDGNKAQGLPSLQQVAQMAAAGAGGFGTVLSLRSEVASFCMSGRYDIGMPFSSPSHSMQESSAAETATHAPDGGVFQQAGRDNDPGNMAAFLAPGNPTHCTPAALIDAFNSLALSSTNLADIVKELFDLLPDGVLRLLYCPPDENPDALTAWALMLNWLGNKWEGTGDLSRQARRLVRAQLRGVDEVRIEQFESLLATSLSSIAPDSWDTKGIEPSGDSGLHTTPDALGSGSG